jgi:hypothetical protein
LLQFIDAVRVIHSTSRTVHSFINSIIHDYFDYFVLHFSNGWYGDLSAGHTMNPGGGSSTYGEMTIRKQYDLGRNGANMAIEGYAGVRHNDGMEWNAPSSNSFKPSGGMVGIRLKISF